MEKQIKTQREKLVISFSGCTKKDEGNDKKDNSSDRINTTKGAYGMRSYSDHVKHFSSQLSYKF